MIRNFFNGFAMAAADSVPGVSGGTIAFLLGFYDDFINSLNALLSGSGAERKRALIFLAKLGVGWAFGMVLCILLLSNLFKAHIYIMSSAFLGLTICAIPFVIAHERESLRGRYLNVIFTLIGVAVVAALTGINPASGGVDAGALNAGVLIYTMLGGALAISAMVLPGISGSTILLILGLYVPVITGVKSLLTLDFGSLPIVMAFALGVVVGIICSIKGISYCLKRFRSQTVYLIIGLMIGSVYAIIMGATTLDEPLPPLSLSTFSIPAFVIGAALIAVIEVLGGRADKAEKLKAKAKK